MINVRSPLRISFLGGGSDFEEHFGDNSGAVFGATIDLYVYVSGALIPPFASERFRFTYRKSESVMSPEDFEHPVARSLLSKWEAKLPPLNLATMSDVPGNSGLGSSSSFVVGLLKLLHEVMESKVSASILAAEAINLERRELGEDGGWQDQLFAAHGGLTLFEFYRDRKVEVKGVPERHLQSSDLGNCLVLIPLVGNRLSGDFSSKYLRNITNKDKRDLIFENANLARDTYKVFTREDLPSEKKIEFLGKSMRRAWEIKIQTSPDAKLERASEMISLGISAGALAGKLCGAGESGFLLFLVRPEMRPALLSKLGADSWYFPGITSEGVEVVYAGNDELRISSSTWKPDWPNKQI